MNVADLLILAGVGLLLLSLGIKQIGHRGQAFAVVLTIDTHVLFSLDYALLGYQCLFIGTGQIVVGILNLQAHQFPLVLTEVDGLLLHNLFAVV